MVVEEPHFPHFGVSYELEGPVTTQEKCLKFVSGAKRRRDYCWNRSCLCILGRNLYNFVDYLEKVVFSKVVLLLGSESLWSSFKDGQVTYICFTYFNLKRVCMDLGSNIFQPLEN